MVSDNISAIASAATTTSLPEVSLFPVRIGEDYGYIDRTGRVVIEPKYEGTDDFSEGLAIFTVGLGTPTYDPQMGREYAAGYRCGYLNESGEEVLEPQWVGAGSFCEGLAPVSDGEKWGFIDRTGAYVLPPEHDGAGSFSEGLAPVWIGDVAGYIDRTGHFVIEPQFEHAGMFREGLAHTDGGSFIDRTGAYVIKPQYATTAGAFGDGLAPVGRLLLDGRPLNVGEGSPQGPLPEGNTRHEWGYIDKTGQLVIPWQFDHALPFSEGFAPVSGVSPVDERFHWWYIDTSGTMVLGPFQIAGLFYGGLAKVTTLDGKNAYIDTAGSIVWMEP